MSNKLWKFILLLLAGVIVIVGTVYLITKRPKTTYQYDKVSVGKITETVAVGGTVKAAENADLSFEQSGKINKKYVAVGDQVKAGQVLLTLSNADAAAQLAAAQAALNKQLAGNRPEYIAQLAAAADQAQANYDQVAAGDNNSLHGTEATAATAENNLKLAQGGENSQIVNDTYENAAALLQATQNTVDNALTKADNILGVDNSASYDIFKDVLSVKDSSQLNIARDKYNQTKTAQQNFSQANSAIVAADHGQVDAAMDSANASLAATRDLLASVKTVLNETITGASMSAGQLDALKTIISGAQSDVVAKITALTDEKHAIANAKNSYKTYQIAFDKSSQDLNDLQNKTSADLAAAQANLDRAKAALADAKNPPREVDVASYRAALAIAAINYNKTILKSPIDGTVARQDGELGSFASPNVPLVTIISNNKYQIETYVAENDLPAVKVGEAALVTLDNLSDGQTFTAQVVKVDPAASVSPSGTAAYKVTLQFNQEDERLKVGLTANVKIIGAEKDGALIIPAHDVIQKNGQYFASVFDGQKLEQKPITIGLRGENDQWEVLSGFQAGDSVVSFSAAQ